MELELTSNLEIKELLMNDFMTKEIDLCGDDLMSGDGDSVVEIIYDALTNKGIDLTSFAWSINVEYLPQENDDE